MITTVDDRADRHTPELLQLRLVDAGGLGSERARGRQRPSPRTHGVSGHPVDRGGLQVGQHAGQRGGAQRCRRRRHGALRADQQRGRRRAAALAPRAERHPRPPAWHRRSRRGRPSRRRSPRSGARRDDPCAMPRRAAASTWAHRSATRSLLEPTAASAALNVRAAQRVDHQDRVTTFGHAGRDDRQHGDTLPAGEQGDERLVFDLLEPAARTWDVSPRFHSDDQIDASSWPSHASRP